MTGGRWVATWPTKQWCGAPLKRLPAISSTLTLEDRSCFDSSSSRRWSLRGHLALRKAASRFSTVPASIKASGGHRQIGEKRNLCSGKPSSTTTLHRAWGVATQCETEVGQSGQTRMVETYCKAHTHSSLPDRRKSCKSWAV